MIESTSKSTIRFTRLFNSDAAIGNKRAMTSLKKRRGAENSLTFSQVIDDTTQNTSMSKIPSGHLKDTKGWNTERNSIANIGITTVTNIPIKNLLETKKKNQSMSTLKVRPNTTGHLSLRKSTEGQIQEDPEQAKTSRDFSMRVIDEVKESILKDIPRMQDISRFVEGAARCTREKFRQVDKMCRLNYTQTFKSQFEEEVIADVIGKVEAHATGSNPINRIRTIKFNTEERFKVDQDKQVHFRMKTENIKDTLVVQITFFPKNAQYFFELYVSSVVMPPTLSRHDYKFVDKKNFEISYGRYPNYLNFTLSAITAVDCKIVVSIKKEKNEENEETTKKSKINHWEYFRKALEHMREKKIKHYPFMDYTNDQMNKFLKEVSILKKEKQRRYLNMTKDGRDIMKTNRTELRTLDPEVLLMRIRQKSEERMIRTEEAQRRKEELANEKQTKRLLLLNRATIKQQARQAYSEIFQQEELKKQLQMKWLSNLAKGLLIHNLYQKLKEGRVAELLLRMTNKTASKIQKAYREYMDRFGKTAIEKKTRHIREGLNTAACMINPAVKKMSGEVMTRYLEEVAPMVFVQLRVALLHKSVVKLQQAYRRRKFRWYIRKVCVMKILQDICYDRPEDDDRNLKILKKKKKEKKNPRHAFYSTLREYDEFKRFVVDYFFRKDNYKYVEDDKAYKELVFKGNKQLVKKKTRKITTQDHHHYIVPQLSKTQGTVGSDSHPPQTSRSRSSSASSISSSSSKRSFDQKREQQKSNKTKKMLLEDIPIDKRTIFKMPNKETIKLFLELEYPKIVPGVQRKHSLNFSDKKPLFLNFLA